MSAEPAYLIGKRVFALWRNDGGHFDRSWVESNGVLTHAQVQSRRMVKLSSFCSVVLISGIGYGLLTIRLASEITEGTYCLYPSLGL